MYGAKQIGVPESESPVPNYYPVLLDIRNRPAIVVGGNRLAAEKAAALVASGALVQVISETFHKHLRSMAERGEVTLRQKTYERGDLAGAFVVVAVTNEQPLIEAIWQETQERNQPVNIADVPRYCTFILPSILRRGQLTIGVSTEGASPGMAKRIRQQLEATFTPAYGSYVDLAALARSYLRQQGISYETRDLFVQDFMASPVLALLETGQVELALTQTSELLSAYGVEVAVDLLKQAFPSDHTREQKHVTNS
jgi:precorrin-2 dehydrogenase/sirohydrochlorin ferrochelatase